MSMPTEKRLPSWLRRPLPPDERVQRVERALRHWRVPTVCHSALCPNRHECFSQGRLTFMILGNTCTRGCAFCGVAQGKPVSPDWSEPERIASVVRELGFSYVVVTSVTRDDLPDGGSAHFAATIRTLKGLESVEGVEVLIPDFAGSEAAIQQVVEAGPVVIGHNVETVPRLYPQVHPQADYRRSLEVIRKVKALDNGMLAKSGLMLGLGEREEEVVAVLEDLREAGSDFVTLGQYLRPSLRHPPPVRYVTPKEFSRYRDLVLRMGFRGVASGPLVRSSFNAENLWKSTRVKNRI